MKIPPNSKSSEEAFIGAILTDSGILNITTLEQEDFYDITLGKIFNLCKVLKSQRKNIDLVVLKDILEKKGELERIGGIMFLVELTELSTSGNWKEYQDIIKENSIRRKIIRYADKMKATAYNGEDSKTALDGIENISNILFREDNKGDILDLVEEFDKIRENFNKQGALGESTVFPVIDKYTQGAVKGSVYMLCAYSNVGKSAVSYAYACDFLKKGYKVLYFSLEVTRGVLMTNLLRCYYEKNYVEIMDKDYYFEMGDFENLRVYDDKTKLEDIKNITRIEKPDYVFIDFVQNIEGLGLSEYENMTKCAKEIQALAIENNCTIFNISQVSNESRFKTDTMQPKGSGQLFFSSDIILGLYKDNGTMFAHLIKNKYGQNDKKFLMIPDFAKVKFNIGEELPEQQNNGPNL